MHRQEYPLAEEFLQKTSEITQSLRKSLHEYSDLYFAGYTQDAIREYGEAHITYALLQNRDLPSPEQLGVEYNTYLNALADVTGELRRRCLDLLRSGYSSEAERLLSWMDDIYLLLVTLDYPDAITNGARRQTDLVRGIVERTRADLTISYREQQLEIALSKFNIPEG